MGEQEAVELLRPQLLNSALVHRPAGYRLSGQAFRVEVGLGEEVGEGFGEGDSAYEKAFSEAVERAVLKHVWRSGDTGTSSNGWAAHKTTGEAVQAGLLELLERHVILKAWEENSVFEEVPVDLWPARLLVWQATQKAQVEFSNLKVLLSTAPEGAAISVLLFNRAGGFVAGHGSSLDFESAVLSAAHECFRAAHAALRFHHYLDVKDLHDGVQGRIYEPGVHSLAYAYGSLPKIPLRIRMSPPEEILSLWSSHLKGFTFLQRDSDVSKNFRAGDRFIAHVQHSSLRQIYWGHSQSGNRKHCPHFVG